MHSTVLISNYGESTFGNRLNYSKPKYRDIWAAVIYWFQVFVIIVLCGYFWYSIQHQISNSNTTSNKATHDDSHSGSSSQSDVKLSNDVTGIYVTLLICMVVGIIFGLFWLQVIKFFAGFIIKAMFFLNIGMWVLSAIINYVYGGLPLAITPIVIALFWSLYTWCVWRRIPFASALLSISSSIVQKYPGSIFISFAVILMQTLWVFIWALAFIGYIEFTILGKNSTNGLIIFLFLISLYWGLQVNRNVSHTTTCGVAATWYFSAPEAINNPTVGAFKRTVTTSFGSVALGSLIVAILEAIRAMIRSCRRGVCICFACCLLYCLDRLIRYFNKYAFAQVAIYGTSFWQSAKATWDLFQTRGMMAIINDDLSGMALMAGAFLGFIVSGLVGYFVGASFYSSGDWYPLVPILLAIIGAIIGFIFCMLMFMVIRSTIVALFVCYSEDPAIMANNRPAEYQRLSEAKSEWAVVYNSYGSHMRGQAMQPQQILYPINETPEGHVP